MAIPSWDKKKWREEEEKFFYNTKLDIFFWRLRPAFAHFYVQCVGIAIQISEVVNLQKCMCFKVVLQRSAFKQECPFHQDPPYAKIVLLRRCTPFEELSVLRKRRFYRCTHLTYVPVIEVSPSKDFPFKHAFLLQRCYLKAEVSVAQRCLY